MPPYEPAKCVMCEERQVFASFTANLPVIYDDDDKQPCWDWDNAEAVGVTSYWCEACGYMSKGTVEDAVRTHKV